MPHSAGKGKTRTRQCYMESQRAKRAAYQTGELLADRHVSQHTPSALHSRVTPTSDEVLEQPHDVKKKKKPRIAHTHAPYSCIAQPLLTVAGAVLTAGAAKACTRATVAISAVRQGQGQWNDRQGTEDVGWGQMVGGGPCKLPCANETSACLPACLLQRYAAPLSNLQ